MAEHRKKAASSFLLPILPASLRKNRQNNDKKTLDSDKDNDEQKKRSITPWKARRQRIALYVQILVVICVISLASRGYHRRHHNTISRRQRREWLNFRKKYKVDKFHKGPVDDVAFSRKQKLLANNPKIAKDWENHLSQYPETREVFEQEAHDMWKPKYEDSPLEWTSDVLGKAVETAGSILHDNTEPYLGEEVTHRIGDSLHGGFDSWGDWTDELSAMGLNDVQQAISDGGQAIYEGGQALLGNLLGANVDSVSDWMGITTMNNNSSSSSTSMMEEWSNWTQSFLSQAHSSAASLWNYTTLQEEEDDDEDIDQTKAAMFQSNPDKSGATIDEMTTQTNKTNAALPEFMTDDPTRSKFAFITTGFPQQEDELWRFESYVLGALKTYLHGTVLFYIVNKKAKAQVDKVCASSVENQQTCARLVPIYVNCPKSDYGIASCCHQDKGMSRIYERYSKFDWYIYGEDDLYFRIDYLKAYVQKIPDPKENAVLLSASPFRSLGQVIQNRTVIVDKSPDSGNCSSGPNHIYPWGKPALIYSNAALKTVTPAYKSLAISKECEAFHVTADSASPIVHWMFQLPLVRLPMIASRTSRLLTKHLTETTSNNTTKKNSDVKRKFNPTQRYIAFRAELGRHNFTDLHKDIQAAKKEATANSQNIALFPPPPHDFRYHSPNGIQETEHFKKYGFAQNWTRWNTFSPKHCVQATTTLGKNLLVDGKLNKIFFVQKEEKSDKKAEKDDPKPIGNTQRKATRNDDKNHSFESTATKTEKESKVASSSHSATIKSSPTATSSATSSAKKDEKNAEETPVKKASSTGTKAKSSTTAKKTDSSSTSLRSRKLKNQTSNLSKSTTDKKVEGTNKKKI